MRTVELSDITWKPVQPMRFLEGRKAVAQYIKQRLLLWRGEYFLDTGRGMPYSSILGGKPNDIDEEEIIAYIAETPYVDSVLTFTSNLDNRRELHMAFTVQTEFGEVEVTI